MNQQNMGKFIAELRKQEQLTQKELADKLGVSDKTISKWECGNGIPDITYLEDLCKALGISVNELLAGERLTSQEAYSEKAEANIMNLMKENKVSKKAGKWTIAGVVLMALLLFVLCFRSGYMELHYYFDFRCLLAEIGICVCLVLIAGARTKQQVFAVLRLTAYPSAMVIMMVGIIAYLHRMSDPSTLGPALSVIFLTLLYASVIYLVAAVGGFIVEKRLQFYVK